MRAFLALGLSLILVTSCATYRLQPYTEGSKSHTQLAVADHDGLKFEAEVDYDSNRRFVLKVVNSTGQDTFIDSDHFQWFTGDLKSWTEVKSITTSEILRRAEEDARHPMVVVVEDDRPTYRQTTTTIGSSNSGLTITRIETSPEPSRRVVVSRGSEAAVEQLKAELFLPVTVTAGQFRRGLVYGPVSKGAFLKLVVPVGDKTWELVFQKVKVAGPFKNLD